MDGQQHECLLRCVACECLIACGCITCVFLWSSSLIVVKDVSSLKHNLMLTSSLT